MASELILIVARATNGVIGKDGDLPWRLPADLKRFKALTMGHPMLMGRKTFDSLPGLLPGRPHWVMTRDEQWQAEGAERVASIEAAREKAGEVPLFVIGGAEILALALPDATRIELTEVHGDIDGDTVMPDPREGGGWTETFREDHPSEDGRPAYSFVTLTRSPPA